MIDLLTVVSRSLGLCEGLPIWLGYSGGVDSRVLLDVLLQLGESPGLIHVNHGFHREAGLWEKSAEELAEKYALKFRVKRLGGKVPRGESLEAFARTERLEFFSEVIGTGRILLGHQAEDQAETLLLQLLRGAGPRGLSGMGKEKPLGQGRILRPLLHVSREEILDYAKKRQLTWIEDDSNQNERFKRNVLRHQVLPILKQHFPGYLKTLDRSARCCALEHKVLSLWGAEKLGELTDALEERFYFKRDLFKDAPIEIQRQLLRLWLEKKLPRPLNERHLQEIEKLMHAEHWPEAFFQLGKLRMAREKESLILLRQNFG